MFTRPHLPLLMAFAVVVLIALLTGHLTPKLVPDSTDYLRPLHWPDSLAGSRTPYFGILVFLFGGGAANGYPLVPIANVAMLFAATILLFNAVRSFGLSDTAALALGLPVLISNPVLLFLDYVHPEIAAIACVLAAIAAVVRISGEAALRRHYVLLALGAGSAYLLKPAFLSFVLVLPVLSFLLSRLHGTRDIAGSLRQAMLVLVLSATAFVGYASVRVSVVGEFNIVSFGGYASSGLSGLMITPDIIDELPDRHRPLAQAIFAGRQALAERGDMLPIPYNAGGQRSFVPAALGYFDVLARSYDNVVHDVVARQMQPGESWIAFNARLQDFFVSVIRADPAGYLAWLVGASARVAGRITVTNAAFMLASLGLCLLFVGVVIRGRMTAAPSTVDPEPNLRFDIAAIVLIVGAYTLANWLPMVMATFPARRYVDTAGLLLAALPLFACLRLWPSVFSSAKK